MPLRSPTVREAAPAPPRTIDLPRNFPVLKLQLVLPACAVNLATPLSLGTRTDYQSGGGHIPSYAALHSPHDEAKTFAALVRAGGPDGFIREAAEQAAQAERQHWLELLERGPSPKDSALAELHARYVRDLRHQLGVGQLPAVVREQTRERGQRKRALGYWGERKAVEGPHQGGCQ